jgi:hypothetical protein
MALAQTEIGGELSRACAHRTGFKRQLKQTTNLEEIERLEQLIEAIEEDIARLQRK